MVAGSSFGVEGFSTVSSIVSGLASEVWVSTPLLASTSEAETTCRSLKSVIIYALSYLLEALEINMHCGIGKIL